MIGSTQRILDAIRAQEDLDQHVEATARLTKMTLRREARDATRRLTKRRDNALSWLQAGEGEYLDQYNRQTHAGKLATWKGLRDRLAHGVETIARTVHRDAQDCPGFVETFRVMP